jgi:uncharacterized lipoprotein YddW (UPF0748 family)
MQGEVNMSKLTIAVLRPAGTVLVLCLSLATVCGCSVPLRQPMRAIWVTRSDYRAPEDVTRIMTDCKEAGFNVILFQVRGNGTAFYRSNVEPWAEELGGGDPGWDPLQLAIDEAHARRMELHAWVNVMPGWRGRHPPVSSEQLYNKHPDWFWVDESGQRQPLVAQVDDREYVFYNCVNPCLPEVRDYLVDVFEDLAANYEIDGLHMDYIRFPNEAWGAGHKVPDYPRDARTLALFRDATGYTPDENPEAWNKWRTEQVTRLVRAIRDMLRWTKPKAALTAAVGSVRENALRHFQDGRRWIDERLVDGVILMNYTDEPTEFGKRIQPWIAEQPPVPVVPGLWFGRHQGKSPEAAARAVKEQIEIARNLTGDFCIFSYAGLFGGGEQRAVRREVLLPFLQELEIVDRK